MRLKTNLLLLLTAGIFFALYPSGCDSPEQSDGEMNGNNISHYTCTMHPSVKQAEPGKCPICGMTLVPVYKEGAPPETNGQNRVRTVNVPLYQQQLIGVQLDSVQIRPLGGTVRAVGHVAMDERSVAAVNLKFSGWIEALHVDYTGQLVQKGQPLFDIYSPELVATQEEYLQALRGTTPSLRQSARERLRLWKISDEQITEIEKAGRVNQRITVHSPIRGHVLSKQVSEGSHVKQGRDLYTIADLSTVWVLAEVYEHELPSVAEGQRAIIRLTTEPGRQYEGRVDYVYPTLNARARTAKVRIVVANPDLKLRPDMYAEVEIAVEAGDYLTVAETAVLNTGTRQLVFVDRGNGRFEPRQVHVGKKMENYYVVIQGLQAGEVVVKSGNFLIDAEAQVQGVMQNMAGAAAAPHRH